MKTWLTIFLLLITAAGTLIPCCRIDDCCADRTAEATHEDKHQAEGTCSPFFACATCPGFVQLSKSISLAAPVAVKPTHSAPVLSFQLSTFAPSFWQPPRFR